MALKRTYTAILSYQKGIDKTVLNFPKNPDPQTATEDLLLPPESHTFTFTIPKVNGKDPLVEDYSYKFYKYSGNGRYYNPGDTVQVTVNPPTTGSMSQKEVILTANWIRQEEIYITIHITYKKNSGNTTKTYHRSGYPGQIVEVELDESTSPPQYYTGKWYNNNNEQVNSINVILRAAVTEYNFTVTAKYTQKKRDINFYANAPSGYSVSNMPENVKSQFCGNDYTIPKTPQTNGTNDDQSNNTFNKKFYKWNTKSDRSGTWYDDRGTIKAKDSTAAVNLYAIWKHNFIYNKGSYSDSGQKNYRVAIQPNGSITIAGANLFTRTSSNYNYSIDHYEDSSGNIYKLNTKYSNINKDITVFPVWKQTEKTYKISYNENKPSGYNYTVEDMPSAQTKYHTKNLKLSDKTPTFTSHTFKQWNTKANGTGTAYLPGSTFTTNADTTLYAIWDIKKYNIFFNENKGEGNVPSTLTNIQFGTILDLRIYDTSGLFKKYYKCIGWNTSSSASTIQQTLKVGPEYANDNNAITLYAVWDKKIAKIRYKTGNTEYTPISPYPSTVKQGNKFETLKGSPTTAFEKDDSTLFGWSLQENSGKRACALGGKITVPDGEDNYTLYVYPFYVSTFDAYYSEYQTTTRGRRIIYQKDYITEGKF